MSGAHLPDHARLRQIAAAAFGGTTSSRAEPLETVSLVYTNAVRAHCPHAPLATRPHSTFSRSERSQGSRAVTSSRSFPIRVLTIHNTPHPPPHARMRRTRRSGSY